MKTVFSNSEISHVFCNRTQNEGRTSNGSMFFKNDTLYSYGYHFELAKFIEYNNETYLFINTASYSNTTAKHQNHVRRSINEALVKDVFYFDFKNYYLSYSNCYEFKLNNTYLTDIINKLLNEAKDHFKSQLKARENTFNYINGVNKQKTALTLITTFESILNNSKELYKIAYIDLAAIREQAGEKAVLIDTNREERERIKKEKAAKKEKENLGKWFSGDYNYPLYNLPIYLRLQDDTVQTSHGANVPLEHARHIINLFDKGIDITGKKIGYYSINEVTIDYIKIGCHKMYFNDVTNFIDQHLRA